MGRERLGATLLVGIAALALSTEHAWAATMDFAWMRDTIPHAGHAVPPAGRAGADTTPANPHAGHGMQAPARPKSDTTPADPHAGHAMADTVPAGHPMGGMLMASLGGGWSAMAMGQAFPVVTFNAPGEDDSPLRGTEAYLTQPAAMINIESPGARFVARVTLNLEGVTQPRGELTAGGWGEGFIDRRHPHTLLHEAMLSANVWRGAEGGLSISAGKGFAPYGTDDPMSRPGLKYPTNHHRRRSWSGGP